MSLGGYDVEVQKEAIPDIGYLHRSIEKIAEKVGYHGFMPYTDRVDYVAAMSCNQGWAMVCEKLAGIEVPRRAEYCRVIACEFNRIASHLLSVGSMGMDIGAYTPFTHALREREYINDLLEELCGARLTFNYMRIGGVAWDLPPDWVPKAIDYNLVGPNLRGSGVKFDVRKDVPYSVYPEFEFDVPVGTGEVGTVGDCF